PGTPDGDRFEVLSALVDAYERDHIKIRAQGVAVVLSPEANPPVNVLLGETARKVEAGEPQTFHVLYRDKLAERLGIAPKERLTMTIVQDDTLVSVSALIDGGDLTADQEGIFRDFLQES